MDVEKLKQMLEAKGIRPTFQRIKILEYLLTQKETHPTADEIYEVIHSQMPTLAKATVYNTLNTFVRHGIASVLMISGEEARYDPIVEPHPHFFCVKCKRVFNIQSAPIDDKCLNLKEIEGNKIFEVHVYFRGICKECLKKSS